MARVQELPDDLPDSLQHHLNVSNEHGAEDYQPTLPPQAQEIRSQTADDTLKMLGKSPLFMNSIDAASGDGEENIELEAIRALQYDGTPAANALNFKEQGNELVKAKDWKDAKEFYSKGLSVLANRIGDQNTDSSRVIDIEAEEKQELTVKEACLVNRALCHLELQNYRSCHLDCVAAIRINERNLKAYYRSASALLALDKTDEALDAAMHGLFVDRSNAALKTLMDKIGARGQALAKTREKRRNEDEIRERKKIALWSAFQKRRLHSKTTQNPPDLEDAHIQLSPDPLSADSTLQFPVMLLYPMHAQSDFIKAFAETDNISQHLDYILPLPWGKGQEYQAKTLEFYAETRQGGLTKVGKNVSLIKILQEGDVAIVDDLINFYVLPRSKSLAWIEEMKKRKGSQP